MPYGGQVSVNEMAGALLPMYLRARQEIGLARYGSELQTFNGRDAIRDLTEELVDGLQYAVQVAMEWDAVLAVLRELALFHAAAGTRAFSVLDEELMAAWDRSRAAVDSLPRALVFPDEAGR